MSVDDFLRHRGLLLATLGTGVIIGATSTIVYHHIYSKKQKKEFKHEIQQLESAISQIKTELDRLSKKKARTAEYRRARSAAGSVTTDATMYSVVGTDDEESEFYDFSSDVEEGQSASRNERTVSESEDMMRGIDHLLKGPNPDKIKAYGLLLEMHEENGGKDPEVLWRLAKVCHLLATHEESLNNTDKFKQYIESGCEYGKQAIDLNTGNSEAHKWYAVNIGSKGQYSSNKEKIQNGFVFKQHIDEALKLKDDDPILYHLMARFQYEVAILSAMERRLAKWLFSEVPEGSITDAISGFLKAEALNLEPWKENELLLAKCYIHEKKYQDAVKWLETAISITSETPQDEKLDVEINKLLSKYRSYAN